MLGLLSMEISLVLLLAEKNRPGSLGWTKLNLVVPIVDGD
jgi:hypothetical protein